MFVAFSCFLHWVLYRAVAFSGQILVLLAAFLEEISPVGKDRDVSVVKTVTKRLMFIMCAPIERVSHLQKGAT